MATNWTCPSCGSHTTIVSANSSSDKAVLNRNSKLGDVGLYVSSISCPNPDCLELHVTAMIRPADYNSRDGTFVRFRTGEPAVLTKKICPEASIIIVPDTVPDEIRDTYREAKLVLPLSGKASAALSRRCLQGMVRDFFKIPLKQRGNLGAELSHVKDRIDAQTWDDIQAVRSVGDIGAHMDKNVDYIIEVHPREAALLIELIEYLFKSWYIERDRRQKRSASLAEVLNAKRQEQSAAKKAAAKPASSDAAPATNTNPNND